MRRGEDEYRILKKLLKLKGQQLKTILYIYKMLYQNHMGKINKKTKTYPLKKKKKKSNINTTRKLIIKSQEKRTKEEGKKKAKQ